MGCEFSVIFRCLAEEAGVVNNSLSRYIKDGAEIVGIGKQMAFAGKAAPVGMTAWSAYRNSESVHEIPLGFAFAGRPKAAVPT